MKKMCEVVRLRLEQGASVRQIAAACSVGRATVGDYIVRIQLAGLSWPAAGELSEAELVAQLFPSGQTAPKRPLPNFGLVHRELSRKGVTLMVLWQEYQAQTVNPYSDSRCEPTAPPFPP